VVQIPLAPELERYLNEQIPMSVNNFPEIISNLPKADIPIKGLSAFLFQGEGQQVLFMEFSEDTAVPEHSHEAQWGSVLAGEIELIIEGEKSTLHSGDSYFIPANAQHSATIKAGYKDITLFNQKDRYQQKILTKKHNT
jgi:quercetin dioxygenase-like cupin family protein